ncbi:hypothetical protein HBH70_201550 [Parastagonospora nodorum]|nr:hypothetical protein HBH52_010100 [Parastagonospora nodorum]KAH4075161.1 hypothetical protein HBH50_034680 [Parastagonospora nodorum]KAH4097220.1 hypothetical protein HBH48_043550 [Parastagonospora nodorum]KAH4406322.1 hypothetical protein HBH92_166590 [Parastagonospora nodorum]KAH4431215.1 hypothetical protein HBH93_149840 [Parastagonospora nodorum]
MRSSLPALLLLLVPFGTTALRSVVSKDATCGGTKGYTCLGSKWGNCCSQYNWCGSTTAYCGKGCNSEFGTCTNDGTTISSSVMIVSSSTHASTIPVASSQPVSADARCGPSFGGKTCQGSRWGNCCSQYSYCGSTSDYCSATTCRRGFGQCNSPGSSSVRSSSTLAPSRLSSVISSSSPSSSSSVAQSSSTPLPSSAVSSTLATSSASGSLSLSLSTVQTQTSSASSTSSPSSASISSDPSMLSASSATPSSESASPVAPSGTPEPPTSSAAPSSTPEPSTNSVTPSSTPEPSTSSAAPLSTPIRSAIPSSTPSTPACRFTPAPPTCNNYNGDLSNVCPANDMSCISGYQIRCNVVPQANLLGLPIFVANAAACAASCTAASCGAAAFNIQNGRGVCARYTTNIVGYSVAAGYTAFLRLCT